MSAPKILVVGSFVMDQTAYTEVFPSEGQTVLGKRFKKAPGGKGANQAMQCVRLGADVTMFGKLGRDANGEEMVRVCKENGIDTQYITYDETVASGCAVIVVEESPGRSSVNRIIVISGTNMEITKDDVAFLEEKIADYDMVMLQLEIPMEINELVAQYAYSKGVPVMLNSAPSAPLSDSFLSRLTYISPNEHEAEDMTGIHIAHDGADFDAEAARTAAEILCGKGIGNVIITIGSAGAVLLNDYGFFHSPCVEGVAAADPTAAGDSFVGAFCVGACCGWNTEELLSFSNHTAAITVSRFGAMPSLPRLEEVESFMRGKGAKIPNLARLKKGGA